GAAGHEEVHLMRVDHGEDVRRRLCRSTVPPKAPSTRTATPPPVSARIEPSPPAEPCARAARSIASASAGCESGLGPTPPSPAPVATVAPAPGAREEGRPGAPAPCRPLPLCGGPP